MENKIFQGSSSYNLLPLLVRSSIGYVKNSFTKYEPLGFPSEIGDYLFHSRMKKVGPRKSYPLAIYKNIKGEKAIAKMKDSRIKGYHYYSLLNEITMYEILNGAIKRIGNKVPKEFSNIYIPKFLHKYEDKKRVVSLIEFVEGDIAEKISPSEKIPIYFKVMDFLQFIGEHLTESQKKRISKRTPIKYLLLYPLLVIKAIVTYPQSTPSVIRGIPVFLTALPAIFSDSKKTLVHRDLHFMNILISKHKISLIDLQQCVYTEPLHELITTLRYWWNGWRDEQFGKLLLREILKRYSGRKNFRKLFQGYSVNSVTHGLTGPGFSKKIINGWIDFLKFAINPTFEKFTK